MENEKEVKNILAFLHEAVLALGVKEVNVSFERTEEGELSLQVFFNRRGPSSLQDSIYCLDSFDPMQSLREKRDRLVARIKKEIPVDKKEKFDILLKKTLGVKYEKNV